MGRGMKLVSKKKERQIAFLKKKSVLVKKAQELSVLCDVKVGVIIFPQDGDNNQTTRPEPLIWPENPQEIHSLINSFKNSGEESSIYNKKKSFNLSMFLNNQIQRAEHELAKLKEKNVIASKYPSWDDKLNGLSSQDLVQFAGILETKIQDIKNRANLMKEYQAYFAKLSSSSSVMDASHNPLASQDVFGGSTRNTNYQWSSFQPQPMNPEYGVEVDAKPSSRSVMDASHNPLANQYVFGGSTSNTYQWNSFQPQPMNPQYGVEVPMYNTFEGNFAMVPKTEVANHSYGYKIEDSMCPYAPTMQPLQFQVPYPMQSRDDSIQMHAAETEKIWWSDNF